MNTKDTNNANRIRCSVIIPTYNRSKSLLRTLDSVVSQSISADEYEIIIVDDGSTNDMELNVKCQMSNVKCPEIRYFKIKHCGQPKAKNFGIKEARGEILFFTDDDCIVPRDWMERHIKGYEKYPEAAGAGGWYVPPKNENRFFQKTGYLIDCLFNLSHYGPEPKIINTFPACVALIPNASYKKSALEEIGGFDAKTAYIEDVELKYRMRFVHNKNIVYIPVNVEHRCTNNFWRYARKLIYQGMAKQYCNDKYFGGKPPLAFDVSVWRAPKKLFMIFSNILATKNAKKSDLPAIFIYLFLETPLNAIGGFYEKYFS